MIQLSLKSGVTSDVVEEHWLRETKCKFKRDLLHRRLHWYTILSYNIFGHSNASLILTYRSSNQNNNGWIVEQRNRKNRTLWWIYEMVKSSEIMFSKREKVVYIYHQKHIYSRCINTSDSIYKNTRRKKINLFCFLNISKLSLLFFPVYL